jgi:hypothetical protein
VAETLLNVQYWEVQADGGGQQRGGLNVHIGKFKLMTVVTLARLFEDRGGLNVHIGKFKLMAVVTLINKASILDFVAIGHTGTKCFARIKNLWRHGRTWACTFWRPVRGEP